MTEGHLSDLVGTEAPAIEVDAHTTALLVMDFQNDIVDPEGLMGANDEAARRPVRRAIEHTAKVIETARAGGVRVIHVRIAFRKGYPEMNDKAPMFAFIKAEEALIEGSWGSDFHPELKPAEGEVVITKRGVSALAGTELNGMLRSLGITTLALTGVVTHFVVEGTAREAVDLGYHVIVLEDCCASFSDARHQSALDTLSRLAIITRSERFSEAVAAKAR